MLLAASPTDAPVVTEGEPIKLCQSDLDRLDLALRPFADMLTASRGEPFHVSCLSPTVGLLGPDAELEAFCGLTLGLEPAVAVFRLDDSIDLKDFTGDVLSDRGEGLALLAEALTHTNDLGRYSQLLRVLENGFGRGIGRFNFALQQFLQGGATRHRFEPSEIQHWIDGRPHAINPNAAMPSFHVCWMLIAAAGLRRMVLGAVRWAPPVVMVLAVFTTGNH